MPVTRELVRAIRARIEEDPGLRTDILASEFHVSEAEVITCLPLAMRLRARNTAFEAIWNIISGWERVSFDIAHCAPEDPQAGGGAGPGSLLLPFYRTRVQSGWPPRKPFAREDVGFIWFVSKPLLGEESHSIRFFDKLGRHLLSVYICRDRAGNFPSGLMADFTSMRERFGITPVPTNRCTGCGGCASAQ